MSKLGRPRKRAKELKQPLTIRLDPTAAQRLRHLATQSRRTRTSIIEEAIERFSAVA